MCRVLKRHLEGVSHLGGSEGGVGRAPQRHEWSLGVEIVQHVNRI